MLSERYFKKTGIDVPIYPVYYQIKKRIMVIGKPVYMQDLVKKGMNRDQIAEHFRVLVNNLYYEYINK